MSIAVRSLIVALVCATCGVSAAYQVLATPQEGLHGLPMPAASIVPADLCGGSLAQVIEGPNILVIQGPKGVAESAFISHLKQTGKFQHVGPNPIVAEASVPNDPLYSNQWHLNKISAERLSDINPLASTVVAVVGSGIEYTHPDLAANMVNGFNVLQNLSQAAGGDVSDVTTSGHDTRIAGIIGAVGNNGIGVAGVGWNLKVMPVRCTNATNGSALLSNLLTGITWAVNNGAKVVNVSYEGVADPTIETAGAWARTQGANLVWAAGNSGIEHSTFDHKSVTIVGGTDQNDVRLSISNYGRAVDLYAPAIQVYSTKKGGTYGNAPQGTSFAAPQVAACIAYLHAEIPGITPAQAEYRVLRRAADRGPYAYDYSYGWGRLNAAAPIDWPERRYRFVDLTPTLATTNATTYPIDINDNGDITGEIGGDPFRKMFGQAVEWLPGQFGEPYSMNIHGSVVGIDTSQQGVRVDADGTVTHYQNQGTFAKNVLLGINDSGQVSGSQYNLWSDWTSTFWSDPATPTSIYSRIGRGSAIDNRGVVVGNWRDPSTLNHQAFAYHSVSHQIAWLPNPRYQDMVVYRGTETDYICGFHADGGGRYAAVWRLDPPFAAPAQVQEYGPNSTSTEAIGIDNNGDAVGAANGQGWIFTGLSTGKFQDLLTTPLSVLEYTTITHLLAINNRGNVVGRYLKPNGKYGIFLGEAVDDFHALVDMGQLGLNQSYFGSIPPTVAAQILDSNGNTTGNGQFISLNYNASTGAVALPMMQQEGDYRIRFQVNSDLVPGYEGSGYLSKIYPSFDHPAMPSDTHFIPMQELIMGDIDGDNEVGPGDFGLLSSAFGTVDGDSNWDSHADIDGDGEVGPSDFGALSANFGAAGE